MRTLYLILYIFAAAAFLLAGFLAYRPRAQQPTDVTLVAAGLFFWVLVPLIQTADTL